MKKKTDKLLICGVLHNEPNTFFITEFTIDRYIDLYRHKSVKKVLTVHHLAEIVSTFA